MKKINLLLSLLLLIGSTQIIAQTIPEKELLSYFHKISSNQLHEWVVKLSSEEFKGRLTGTPEFMKCAEWVAGNFKEWGIKPFGDNGTYFQDFDRDYTVVYSNGGLQINYKTKEGKSVIKKYEAPKDYYPGHNSAAGTITGQVVYVGFGVTAPELNYDDYDGIDVKGKIVLVDGDVPYQKYDDELSKWAKYSGAMYKFENAVMHGARGLLYVGKSANPNTKYNKNLIYCHIDESIVDELFLESGTTHKELKEKIVKSLNPSSLPLNKKASITANTKNFPEGKAANVIGIIEGTDPELKNEVIIIGGHLDGQGKVGSILFPSSWDNASGTVNILAAAKALGNSKINFKRSIMFILFGGEESGLNGSLKYCAEPKFPKEKTVVFFNLDMPGIGTGLSVGGGLTYPLIYKHFEEANKNYLHRDIKTSASRKSLGRPRSDGAVFQNYGFRTMSIGTTGEDKKGYYHEELDTPETLSYETMEDVAKLVYLSFVNMANANKLVD